MRGQARGGGVTRGECSSPHLDAVGPGEPRLGAARPQPALAVAVVPPGPHGGALLGEDERVPAPRGGATHAHPAQSLHPLQRAHIVEVALPELPVPPAPAAPQPAALAHRQRVVRTRRHRRHPCLQPAGHRGQSVDSARQGVGTTHQTTTTVTTIGTIGRHPRFQPARRVRRQVASEQPADEDKGARQEDQLGKKIEQKEQQSRRAGEDKGVRHAEGPGHVPCDGPRDVHFYRSPAAVPELAAARQPPGQGNRRADKKKSENMSVE
eukprot:792567-Prorocentrum_minimum.AAC.5